MRYIISMGIPSALLGMGNHVSPAPTSQVQDTAFVFLGESKNTRRTKEWACPNWLQERKKKEGHRRKTRDEKARAGRVTYSLSSDG